MVQRAQCQTMTAARLTSPNPLAEQELSTRAISARPRRRTTTSVSSLMEFSYGVVYSFNVH
jgi:hypothetical protein